ncbi:hypothetical protein [Brevibacillus sp. SYSU BS000544]|uniref:hypothetical protein n=1 Tax=Brevibacillus sp. SYSU BS000544 TaxID=3416443 RepID=UPI003CE473AE
MVQLKKLLLCLLPMLILGACSATNQWSYELKGDSPNWRAIVQVVPDNQTGAVFVGKLQPLTDRRISYIEYEAKVTRTSEPSGNIKNPSFPNGEHVLFQDVPNNSMYQEDFKNGVSAEEIKNFFGEYPVFHITWTDEQGEHSETIQLRLE